MMVTLTKCDAKTTTDYLLPHYLMSIAMKTAEPIHPGEILLEEFLKAYDPPVSQTEAAAPGWRNYGNQPVSRAG